MLRSRYGFESRAQELNRRYLIHSVQHNRKHTNTKQCSNLLLAVYLTAVWLRRIFRMQIACDVSIPAAFHGVEGTAIYIDTEGSFVPERVAEIAQGLVNHLHSVSTPVRAIRAVLCRSAAIESLAVFLCVGTRRKAKRRLLALQWKVSSATSTAFGMCNVQRQVPCACE